MLIPGYLRKRSNGFYQMVITTSYDPNTKKRKIKYINTKTKNKKEAEHLLFKEREKLTKIKETQSDEILFVDLLEEWLKLKERTIEKITYAGYLHQIRKIIIPYFIPLNLSVIEIKVTDIEEFYNYQRIERNVSEGTIRHRHAIIRQALDYAMKVKRIVPNNEATLVTLGKKTRYKPDIFTGKELLKLFSKAQDTLMELPVFMGAFYGLRREEIIGLKWKNFDFKKKTFLVKDTVTAGYLDGKAVLFEKEYGKTRSSLRELPIYPSLEKLLDKIKSQDLENQRIYKEMYSRKHKEYIYKKNNGVRVLPDYVTKTFTKLLKKNGFKKIRLHDLRHSFGSFLYSSGLQMKDIQEWLGHANISTTMDIYTHTSIKNKEKGVTLVESLLNKIKK